MSLSRSSLKTGGLPTAARVFERLPRFLRRHRLMTAWMALTREPPLQLVRIRDDSFAFADMSDGFLRLIVIDGEYDTDFFRVADSILADGGEFFDVGANYGLLSFGLAGRHGDRIRFHLFEPIPRLLDAIGRSQNLYPQMDMRINAVAVSDFEGELHFAVAEEQTGRSHIDAAGGLLVGSTTIDAYMDAAKVDRIGLLKLDVEGYELPALRGAVRALDARAFGAIYFEYFEKCLIRVGPPSELLKFIDDHGYEVCLCRQWDLDRAGPATHTFAPGIPGRGLPLIPLRGRAPPSMTDLLAVPKEHVVAV